MATGVSIGGGSGDASGDLYKLWSGGDPQGMYDYTQTHGISSSDVDSLMMSNPDVSGWKSGMSQGWVDENITPQVSSDSGYLLQAQPTTPPVTALPPGAIPLTDQPAGISVGGGGVGGIQDSTSLVPQLPVTQPVTQPLPGGVSVGGGGSLPTTGTPTPAASPTPTITPTVTPVVTPASTLYDLWKAGNPRGMYEFAQAQGLTNDAVDQLMMGNPSVTGWQPGMSQSWVDENITPTTGATGDHASTLYDLWSSGDPYGMLKYAQDNGLTNDAVDQLMMGNPSVTGWTAGMAQTWVDQNIDTSAPPTMEATLSEINQPTDTVAGQLESLLGADSPYIDRARLSAMEYANSRGLLNSSMAAGAGEAAAIDAALPIAQSDASAYLSQRLANQTAGQEAGVTNVNIAASQRIQALKNAGAEAVSRIQAETTLTAGREKIASAEGISEAGLTSAEKIQSMRDANSIVLAKINNDATVELADLEAQMRLLGIRGDLGQQYLASSSALIQNHAMRETSIQNSQGLDDDAKVFALGVNDQLTKDMFSANDSFWVTVNSSMDWTQLSG